MDKLKVIIVNESLTQSIIADTYTFACLIGCLFANFYLLGDSGIVKTSICILFLAFVLARGDGKIKRMTPDEALKYLTDNKPMQESKENS